MEKTKTVIINGRHYDPQTGLPVKAPTAKKAAGPSHPAAAAVHSSAPQRSQTLNRRVVKKLAPAAAPVRSRVAAAVHKPTVQASRTSTGRTMDIARSKKVARFAPQTVATPKPAPVADHAPVAHPMAERALKRHDVKKMKRSAPAPSAVSKKQQEISKALSKPSPSREPRKKQGFWARHKKLWIVIASVIVVLLIAGYVALVNLPGISVAFAAHEAGMKASYPGYTPDGYSLQQPVTFSDGQVTLNFVANGGGKGYTITETRSSWDSSAVLENVVQKNAGTNYITTQDSGLTIYSYTGNAAWVNNSIFYSISTKAPLSNEQIRNIATSL